MMRTSLAKRLRVLRAERGLTLRQAAELAGVRAGTLSGIERGTSHARDVTLSKLAKVYDVPVADLLEDPAVPLAQAPQSGPRVVYEEAYTPENRAEVWQRAVDPESWGLTEELRAGMRIGVEDDGERIVVRAEPDPGVPMRTRLADSIPQRGRKGRERV